MSARLDRRTFLAALPPLAIVGYAGCGASGAASHPSEEASMEPAGREVGAFGVQLYTLRRAMADDLDATLAAIAEAGYAEVEVVGLFGLTHLEMREKLDAVGLRCASSHLGISAVRERWAAELEGAQELGQSLIVVPSLPGDERTRDGLARIADDFNRAGEEARAAGIRFGYHNHDWEFEPLPDGTQPIRLLLDRTDPELVDWQMDIFWTVNGGGDAAALMEERAGRVTSVHVKDRTADGRMVDVGEGVIDFRSLLTLGDRLGMRHLFVEHDFPDDPVQSVRRSLDHLRSLEL